MGEIYLREHPFKLDARLNMAALMVRKGCIIADIGTDHGYLPVWLTRKGICPKAIAADINEMPLNKAKQTVIKYNAQDMVSLRLSDGLDKINPDEVDDIIIAGMGGDAITGIIARCNWLKDSQKHLILQPMTCAERLRKYLYENGYSICQEEIVIEHGKMYTIMLCIYSGKIVLPDIKMMYIGKSHDSNEYALEYLEKQYNRLISISEGLKKSAKHEDEHIKYYNAAKEIMKIIVSMQV